MPCASRRLDRHVIPADAASVRDLLLRLEKGTDLFGLSATERDCTLLVLAEALNNVVEHGYAGRPGWIGLVRARGGAWRIMDGAQPFPCVPSPPMPDGSAEGGFGWPLIRALADDIRLHRKRGLNVLTLRIRPEALSDASA
jgi:serine/threonine-protein kinase RsbW